MCFIYFILIAKLLFSANAQVIPNIYINTSTIGTTKQKSEPIFNDFKKTESSQNVGVGGQVLYQFTIPSLGYPTDIKLSTCEGSNFDTYLVLFDRNPEDPVTATDENGTMIIQNPTAIAESANDILCDNSINHATLFVALNEGTYFVLVTGDGDAYGKFNLSLTGTPKYERTIPPWSLDRIDQRYLPMDNEYSVTTTAEDVLIYLIDSGVNIDHDEFEGRVKVGYDFVRYTKSDTPDCTGHGTHTAGLIAGKTFGVAKKATIVSLRVYGCSNRATVSSIVDALQWILAHSKSNCFLKRCLVALMVANYQEPSSVLKSILKGFVHRQIPVIVPAGDHNARIKKKDACGVFPANHTDFITVGATTRSDSQAHFSNIGDCVDLYAPGVSMISAWHSSNNAAVSFSGTKQATALVTGVVAILLSINNGLNAAEVKHFLSSVSTPNIPTSALRNESTRLVYVRSVPTDRGPIPLEGFVQLQMTIQVNFSSCNTGKPLFELFRETLSEITDVEVNDIAMTCEPVISNEIRPFVWNDFDDRTNKLISWTKQINQVLNINVLLTAMERKASRAFTRLEQKLATEKENIEEKVTFKFKVTTMPWAIDSKEIIYWGAPTHTASEQPTFGNGIIIAITMSAVVILCVIGVTSWLWHRRVTKKDEIESMIGSADMDKGPIHFHDFDDDSSGKLKVNRSFRNLAVLRGSNGSKMLKTCDGNNGLTSMSSFTRRGDHEAEVGNSIRIQSFGPEAFAGINLLADDDDKQKREAENDQNWRARTPGRMNSILAGDIQVNDIEVQSMDGEAFAMLMNMGSRNNIVNDINGDKNNRTRHGILDDNAP